MKVFVLGLDGATWDVLRPLADAGDLPNLARLMGGGASGTLESVFPPLSPVAWTGVMTGQELGQARGLRVPRIRPRPARRPGQLVAGDQGRAGLGDRRPARQGDRRRRRADELPAPAGARVLPRRLPQPGRRPRLRQRPGHLRRAGAGRRAVSALVHRRPRRRPRGRGPRRADRLPRPPPQGRPVPDGPVRLGPVHVRPDGHRPHPARALARLGRRPTARAKGRDLSAVREGYVDFWQKLDDGVGEIEAALPAGHGRSC